MRSSLCKAVGGQSVYVHFELRYTYSKNALFHPLWGGLTGFHSLKESSLVPLWSNCLLLPRRPSGRSGVTGGKMNGWWTPMSRAFATVVAFSADSGASLTVIQPHLAMPRLCLKARGTLLPVLSSSPPPFSALLRMATALFCSVWGYFHSCNGKSVQSLLMWSLTWMFPRHLYVHVTDGTRDIHQPSSSETLSSPGLPQLHSLAQARYLGDIFGSFSFP